MPVTQLAPPYPIFIDKDGSPLDAGFVYFGVVNLNPETNPIQVFFDAGLTQPAAQPIRTINGYPSRNGSPAILFANSQFSVTVRDKKETLVVHSASPGSVMLLAGNNLSDLTDASLALTNLGVTATAAELNFVDGVTSAIQTQLNDKPPVAREINSGTGMLGGGNLTQNRTLSIDIASQAEAVAGTDDAHVMTPLRTKQQFDAFQLLTLLGTLTTTSGTTQTLSTLTLTGFASLLILVDGVSHDNTSLRHLRLGGQQISTGSGAAAALFNGPIFVFLGSGQSISMVFPDAGTASFRIVATAITTASTSLSFTLDGAGIFDAGTIRVYGIKS